MVADGKRILQCDVSVNICSILMNQMAQSITYLGILPVGFGQGLSHKRVGGTLTTFSMASDACTAGPSASSLRSAHTLVHQDT